MGVYGVISGEDGSNPPFKTGGQFVVFSGTNTYRGYTQIGQGEIIVQGNVLPAWQALSASAPPPSCSPAAPRTRAVASASRANTPSRARNTEFSARAPAQGSAQIEGRTNETAVVTGADCPGHRRCANPAERRRQDIANFRGGMLDIQGVISGAGSVLVGTSGSTPDNGGTIRLSLPPTATAPTLQRRHHAALRAFADRV